MTKLRLALAATTALSLAAAVPAAPAFAQAADAAPAAAAAQSEHDRLFALFAAADEKHLELNPIMALFRGDMRYADQIGGFLTDEYNAQTVANAQANLAALRQIDRAALNETDRIAYDVFEYDQQETLKDYAPEILALSETRPINHFSGFHTFYPTFASGQGAAPFKTLEDYENNLKRHAEYVELIDRSIAKFREGQAAGVYETKLTIGNVIEQLDTQLAMPLEESPLWGPVTMFPEGISDADKARLTKEYRTSVEAINAVHTRLRDYLRDEYLPQARDSVGLSQMKGGAKLYEHMIESTTTLPLTADYVHNLGLSEVARIKTELEKIKAEVGFEGTLNEFFDYVRTDPKFKPESREALTQSYYDIGKQVDAKIGDYFSLVPKTPLEIKPYEPFREKFEAGGSYMPGAPDGSRPGTFYFNAYDLPSRLTTGNVTLYLHEGAPGHHFQISLAQENEALPAFMRFGGYTAYSEGWGLYAETLGYEMGFYDDPWNRYGTLQDEQLRAMRLVVDSGIHAKGWTREQAIDFMLENSGMTRTEVVAEVERYIAIPSQALAYKIGALKIQELREKAEAALGENFDIKAFHAQVLGTGPLPMPVLEKKIDDWIAAGGA
ncbi:DUF885 domain-containing protein [Pelagerythrobacter aerophilus]|uniref:DUF885 domain-containing protein n=1 Tax=Pelagerythrobacter aerophilus TaxID=2306995 RepID=A0A418NGA2_9SPHN|nr:DUF885 domain-containing protein [Pelagerythrobacter aerophilus]RIV77082.1 DUF885 domain-containing protein [Pelagerythrobacter aerophilus]